jgi:hypothetical protein
MNPSRRRKTMIGVVLIFAVAVVLLAAVVVLILSVEPT